MDVTNKNKVIDNLENNEVDFVLVSVLPEGLNIEKLDLLQNKLFLVGRNFEGTGKDIQTKELLAHIPLIFRDKGSGTRQSMESFIERKNFKYLKKWN